MHKMALFLLSPLLALQLSAAPTLPNIFGDHMVLQQGCPVMVWGWADANEAITVTFAGQEKKVTTAADGKWSVKLDALKASKDGRELKINDKVFKDVLVGEVWVCSGQSNMEWSAGNVKEAGKVREAANFPMIRHIQVPKVAAPGPEEDFNGNWQVCSPDTVGRFTAVGYFFGKRLNEELDVPIGLVNSSWGGTRIEPWTPVEGWKTIESHDWAANTLKEIAARDPNSAAGKERYARGLEEIRNWLGRAEADLAAGDYPDTLPQPAAFRSNHQGPAMLYNGMIHPIYQFAIRGALWYQGESNGGEYETYYQKKHALVKGWRQLWNQGDFPFYWVQLANFTEDNKTPEGGDGYARIREAQREAMDLPNTGMAVIIDIGEAKDIHPRNKQDVGHRLAQWALARDYGKDIVPCGPLPTKHEVNGATIKVSFEHVGAGLIVGKKVELAPVEEVKEGKLERFAIAGEDKKWVWAEARIEGKSVIVSSPEVPAPVAVRYAYSANPEGANLYNREGIPASPFRTDTW
ncbi:MAG: sialate O-acetylesterase [Kiritimatiellia bacterium]|jgi:sialate O-acetylesterase